MKIVFLDFDGVINTVRAEIAFRKGMSQLIPPRDTGIDPIAVGMVNTLCEETGSVVVISSSWRLDSSLKSYLNIIGLHWKNQIRTHMSYQKGTEEIWRTPHIPNAVRGEEIKLWMETYRSFVDIENYAILDDDSDMLEEQMSHFVQTNPYDGFRYENYEKAKKILGAVGD